MQITVSAYVIPDLGKEEQNCELLLLNSKMVNYKFIRIALKDIGSAEDSLILFMAKPFAGSSKVSSENESTVTSFSISYVVQI